MRPVFTFSLLLVLTFSAYNQSVDSIADLIRRYDYRGALEAIQKADTVCTDNRLLYLKGVSYKALSRYPEALACYDSIYNSDTANIGLIIEMAECYKAMMDYKNTRSLYEKALEIKPDNPYVMQLLAGLFLGMEKYKEAGFWYQAACKIDTSDYLLKQIGFCYEKMADYGPAIQHYSMAIQLNPEDYQPVFRLGNLYKNKQLYKQGIEVTDTFLLKGHINNDIIRLSGYLHFLNDNFHKAIDRFQSCLLQGDSSLFVMKYLGYSCFKLNDFKGTKEYLGNVFQKDSSDVEVCYALALAYDVPQSIRYFKAAISIASPVVPVLSDLYRDLSLALTKDRKYDEGLDMLLKALELTPRDASLVYKLAIHYDNWMDDKLTALKYYRDFMATRTDSTAPFIVTGTSIIDQEDYQHAENRIRDIEDKLYPQVPDVQVPEIRDTTMNSW